jgi:hypothetical protein
MGTLVAQNNDVFESVIIEIAHQALVVSGFGDEREGSGCKTKHAVAVKQQAELIRGFHEEALVTVMLKVDHTQGPVKARFGAEHGGGRVGESDGNAFWVRLLEFEREADLRVLTALEGGVATGSSGLCGGEFLMCFNLLRRLVVAPQTQQDLAEIVMGRGMFGLELEQLFEFLGRLLEVAILLPRARDLKADGVDGAVNLFRLLQMGNCLGRPAEAEQGGPGHEMRGGGIGVQLQHGVGGFESGRRLVREQMGVGQVEQGIRVRGLEPGGFFKIRESFRRVTAVVQLCRFLPACTPAGAPG